MRFVDGLKAHYRDLQCDTTSHSVTSSTALSTHSSRSRKALAGKKGAGKKGGGDSASNKSFSVYGGNRSRSKSVFPDSEAAPGTKTSDGQAAGEEQHSSEKSEGLGAKIMKILSRICPCVATK